METSGTIKRLQVEWTQLVADSRARETVARWSARHERLRGCEDLDDVLARCHRRDSTLAANAALSALLQEASAEPLAARAALQALLPGLAALMRKAQRLGWARGRSSCHVSRPTPWCAAGELEQELLALAWGCITQQAGRDLEWPASTLLGQVWRRIRVQLDRHRRTVDRSAPLVVDEVDAMHQVDPDTWSTWEQQSAQLLRDAVQAGKVAAHDGALIYRTRVLGLSTADVAESMELDYWATVKRRRRAELGLAAVLEQAA